ncbi:thiamine phosphate synthase [Acetobacter sp. AN02]|uniref:thiamine phosphate synthase n=1 Tax=Acetobacter sp. AN02 TaxID=2894186 RepID=UPI002434326B|nr:thiamine phosphate synthase [Acetobacter sp. AN02]MDG6093791.1 thiamine phosphate synthase [Acetobacter sp. AN02]
MNDTASGTADPCELYLVTPVVSDVRSFLPVLERTLSLLRPSALRLRPEGDEAAQREIISLLCPKIQAHDVALILEGPPALARSCGCDGVHVPASEVAAARRAAGDNLQLGAFCADGRDDAMTAGEDGADYISFSADKAMLAWWRSVAELPGVAELPDFNPDDSAGLLKELQACSDFIAVGGEALWSNPEKFLRLWGG